jgi:hypothetical protein
MGIVDANFRFIFVDIGGWGSESDGGNWSRSELGKSWMEDRLGVPLPRPLPRSNIMLENFIVADAAFPAKVNIMRPYTKPKTRGFTDTERVFNFRLSRARRVVENSFGILASRWRIFRKPIIANETTVDHIVMATVCLHNFLRDRLPSSPQEADTEDEHGYTVPGTWRDVGLISNLRNIAPRGLGRLATREAYAARDTLRDYFVSDEGSIDAQVRVLTEGRRYLPPVFQNM